MHHASFFERGVATQKNGGEEEPVSSFRRPSVVAAKPDRWVGGKPRRRNLIKEFSGGFQFGPRISSSLSFFLGGEGKKMMCGRKNRDVNIGIGASQRFPVRGKSLNGSRSSSWRDRIEAKNTGRNGGLLIVFVNHQETGQ